MRLLLDGASARTRRDMGISKEPTPAPFMKVVADVGGGSKGDEEKRGESSQLHFGLQISSNEVCTSKFNVFYKRHELIENAS